VDCINHPSISALDNFNAAVLCSNSGDAAARTCFNNSSLSLFDNEAAVMCQRATHPDTPNDCYANTPLTLPEPDAAVLCSQSTGLGLNAGAEPLNCYSQTPLTLSDADAAILCQKSKNANETLNCYMNSPTWMSDSEAAILCSGAGSSAAANDCAENTATALSNFDAAVLCSGTSGSLGANGNARLPIRCYNTTSTSLSEADSAVLCSANNGILTSMYSINTQYMNRATGGRIARIGASGDRRAVSGSREAVGGGLSGRNPGTGLIAFGSIDSNDEWTSKQNKYQRVINNTKRKSLGERRGTVALAQMRKSRAGEAQRTHTGRRGAASSNRLQSASVKRAGLPGGIDAHTTTPRAPKPKN
jgi:hypothetical protein